jgi:hypothetical protein
VARMGEERNVYKVSLGKPEGKRQHGRQRRRREDGSEWILGRLFMGEEWIQLSQDRGRWPALVITVMNTRVQALWS